MSNLFPDTSNFYHIKHLLCGYICYIRQPRKPRTEYTMIKSLKKTFAVLCCLSLFAGISAQSKTDIPTIHVDKNGVMRWSDTNNEASFYGVNYTLPFAHAYRAMNYLGKDHKAAIDKDVYHFARLGFNAYRIHIWDVEISDGKGQLLTNDHLDLLDYLIAKLRERNIRVLITTMTNFGNGYPERNINTGAFSYLYDKCKVHSTPEAIAAQQNYIGQLVQHVNPYTKESYKDDPYIVGFEINNEPCHADTPKQTEEYINQMLSALKKAGNKKPVFYNVSHNSGHVQAYYNTAVQGTTYQWYPVGLVAGHTRKGNFLPFVDNYDIPFSNAKGFNNKAKAVYEYDPADNTYSYIHPAMARTFRSNGFQWITQFAYDPIDMAWANTEYQTHFLNLAYTPQKAISMKIAAEVAYAVPMNKKYAQYPNDTIFDNFRVSYNSDLSEMNTPEKFYYSNQTTTSPVSVNDLKEIAGYSDSPIINYEGTGAYFLDRLEDGLWRLEVMPDAVQIQDPFEKPSLKKEVVTIAWNEWNMTVKLPSLGNDFTVKAINAGNNIQSTAKGNSFAVKPGVYLLSRSDYTPAQNWTANSQWNRIRLGEYVAPEARTNTFSVAHTPATIIENGKPLYIEAQIVGPSFPDSVIIYTDKVSFWADKNPYVKMTRVKGYTYQAVISVDMLWGSAVNYNIIVCKGGKNYTYPANVEGNPLDWDFYKNSYFSTQVVAPESPVQLVKITDSYSRIETYGIPETSYMTSQLDDSDLKGSKALVFKSHKKDTDARFFWKKYIKDDVANRKEALQKAQAIYANLNGTHNIDNLNVGFITSDGLSYSAKIAVGADSKTYRISLTDLKQGATTLLPAPYPTFLDRYFTPDTGILFDITKIEYIELSTDQTNKNEITLELNSIYLK